MKPPGGSARRWWGRAAGWEGRKEIERRWEKEEGSEERGLRVKAVETLGLERSAEVKLAWKRRGFPKKEGKRSDISWLRRGCRMSEAGGLTYSGFQNDVLLLAGIWPAYISGPSLN